MTVYVNYSPEEKQRGGSLHGPETAPTGSIQSFQLCAQHCFTDHWKKKRSRNIHHVVDDDDDYHCLFYRCCGGKRRLKWLILHGRRKRE